MRCDGCRIESAREEFFQIARRSFRSATLRLCPVCHLRHQENAHRIVFWIGLVLPLFGVVMTMLAPGTTLGPLMWNLVLFQVVVVISTLAHELGHALAARLTGHYVSHIEVGCGRKLMEFRLWGFRWLFRAVPVGGFAFAALRDTRWWRLRTSLFVLGGPAANALLILATLALKIRFGTPLTGVAKDLAPVTVLLLANIPLLLFSLWPYEVRTSHGKLPTDGLCLWRTWRCKQAEFEQCPVAACMYEVQELRAQNKLDAADACIEEGLRLFPDDVVLEQLRSYQLLDRRRPAEARRIFARLLGRYSKFEEIRFTMFNNIAYADILIGDRALLWEADAGSRLALEQQPWNAPIKGTRGMVLVELGQLDEGIKLLQEAFREQEDKGNQALDACYIGIAHARRGDREQGRSYFALARTIDPHCILLDREPAGPAPALG